MIKRYVLCSECGFLCWYISRESVEGPVTVGTLSISRIYRDKFQRGEVKGRDETFYPDDNETNDLGCLRGLWHWTYTTQKNSEAVDAEELRKKRLCSYYFKCEPGYTPEEHKELQRERATNRRIMVATLLGAVIGGVIGTGGAIAVQLISGR